MDVKSVDIWLSFGSLSRRPSLYHLAFSPNESARKLFAFDWLLKEGFYLNLNKISVKRF